MTEQELAPPEPTWKVVLAKTWELLRANPVPLFVVGVIAFAAFVRYNAPIEGRREPFPKAVQKQVDRECTCPRPTKPRVTPKKAAPKKEPRIVIVPPGDPRVTGWPPNWKGSGSKLGGPK